MPEREKTESRACVAPFIALHAPSRRVARNAPTTPELRPSRPHRSHADAIRPAHGFCDHLGPLGGELAGRGIVVGPHAKTRRCVDRIDVPYPARHRGRVDDAMGGTG